MLPEIAVETTDARGVPGDWIENMAFAWLARESLVDMRPDNLSGGHRRPWAAHSAMLAKQALDVHDNAARERVQVVAPFQG